MPPDEIRAEDYLRRIGMVGAPPVSLAGLTALQKAHLATVPFENLDVYRQTGVRTDIEWSLNKIVRSGRGGWCFENNGAFSWLLTELGFDVTRLGAYVLLPPPDTKNMSHLCLRVELDESYLVDVGFGDSVLQPLPLVVDRPIHDGNANYRFTRDNGFFVLNEERGGELHPQYQFTLEPREMAEFTDQSQRLQTRGTSNFTENPFMTRSIDGGPDRVTLLADRIKERTAGSWTERPVDAAEWNNTAKRHFAIDLGGEQPVGPLAQQDP